MSKFDLSDAADFSRLTQGTIANIGSLTGNNPNEWDLQEASYGGVKFHVFKNANIFQGDFGLGKKVNYEGALGRVTDNGGRRKVKYQFPYKDGQTTDDLGRRGYSFEMDAILHGSRYMEGFAALTKKFDEPTPQVLIHPVRGHITCVVEEWQFVHSSDARKAVQLRATFTEHNFSIGSVSVSEASGFKNALAIGLKIFGVIDGVINKINDAQSFARGVKNLIQSYCIVCKTSSAKFMQKANSAFNKKGGNSGIPALVGFNLGGTGLGSDSTGGPTADSIFGNLPAEVASGKTVYSGAAIVSDQNFVVVRSVSDPFNGIPVDQISQQASAAIAVLQLTKEADIIRAQFSAIIQAIVDNGGSLELNDEILDLRNSFLQIQNILRQGVASSAARLVNFVVPRLMSLREAVFAAGIAVDRVEEVDLLNPELLSTNFIPTGTVLRMPSA